MRRSNGDGSVRQVGPGKWECIINGSGINPKTGKYKRIKRVGSTKEEAVERAKKAREEWLIKQTAVDYIDPDLTFGEYILMFLEKERKPYVTGCSYMDLYYSLSVSVVNSNIGKLKIPQLSREVFKYYFEALSEEKSYPTVKKVKQICDACFDWMVENDLTDKNIVRSIRIKTSEDEYDHEAELAKGNRKTFLEQADIKKMLNAYANGRRGYLVVFLFLLETGMRASEFAALRNSSIDFETDRIYIKETRSYRFVDNEPGNGIEEYVKVPKNGKNRYILMNDFSRELVKYMQLKTMQECYDNPDDLLFPDYRNGNQLQDKCRIS